MPVVSALLGDDVDYRTGVPAIFRAKLVGHDYILLHKLGIADEQSRAADAVVVVVLAVDFLVVVAAAQTVTGDAGAVRIREVVTAAGSDARHKQRQTIQA